jgi:alanine racemase
MSHLANADIDDPLFIEHQVLLFKHFYQKICEYGFQPKLKHIANTAGLAKINDPFFNAARSGIGLYGYNPLTPSDRSFSIFQNLQPALQITSQVIGVQHIHAYESVSYGNLRTATQRTKIITVPFGYYE